MAEQRANEAEVARRRRIAVAAVAGLLVAVVGIGLVCGDDGAKSVADRYAKVWAQQNFAEMYGQLSAESKAKISLNSFEQQQRTALATATVRRLTAHGAKDYSNGTVTVPFTVDTRAFGTLKLNAQIPVSDDSSDAKVNWSSSLLLPGVKAGERLSRDTSLPPRAAIYASNGVALAEGPSRTSPIPDVASQIAGTVGVPPGGVGLSGEAQGYPPNAAVGLSGLEKVFQTTVAGRPGGTLRSGVRTLARTVPRPGRAVTSTIVPNIERAAVAAMAGRLGGAAVTAPRTGAVLALAGSAFSETAPPGSTFKLITASAALDAKLTTLKTQYPYETQAYLDGRALQNDNGESCGGSLLQSFANSCNSVFAPLGVKVGAQRLVAMAEKLGFNRPMPNIPAAAISSIPQPSGLQGEDATGSAAIGQGQVVASPLAMTSVAAAIANGGLFVTPTLVKSTVRPAGSRAMAKSTAAGMKQMMLAVVRFGTGTAGAIPGQSVAGKTGTAEIRDTVAPDPNNPDASQGDPAANTDAWFVAFAPAWAPRIAAGVLLDAAGHGGDTAAPAVHDIMLEALKYRG